MKLNKTTSIVLIVCGMLNGCGDHKDVPNTSVNPEIIGTWSNDSGCLATFAKNNNELVLVKFKNSADITFSGIKLASLKESIFSKFSSTARNVKFSGMFTEGQIIIDGYCKEALHKTDSY